MKTSHLMTLSFSISALAIALVGCTSPDDDLEAAIQSRDPAAIRAAVQKKYNPGGGTQQVYYNDGTVESNTVTVSPNGR